MAIAKCVAAWEEVKLELCGRYPTSTCTQDAMSGSLQGRSLIICCLMILLLIKSLRAMVPTANKVHHQPFFLKLMTISKKRNRYKGYQRLELRSQGISQSKNGLLHSWLMILNKCLSYESSCSIKCNMLLNKHRPKLIKLNLLTH